MSEPSGPSLRRDLASLMPTPMRALVAIRLRLEHLSPSITDSPTQAR